MSCRITFWGVCALLLACSMCDGARAELRFEKPYVDLGKIHGGPYLSYSLNLVNAGQQPIQIVETRASCACMQAGVTPQFLRPGERGVLQITVSTLALTAGAHSWTARVAYRDPTNSAEASVQIAAHYAPEVTVSPTNLTIVAENSLNHDITVTDVRSTTLKVVGVESSSPYLQGVVMKQHRNLRGHWVANIVLQTHRDMPPGRHEETLSIYTDDPQYRQLQVSVSVVKKGGGDQVSVHPNRVTLQASRAQPIPSQLLRVHSTGTEAVNIRNITSDIPGFSSRWAPGPGVDATLRVLVDGSRLRGETQGTVQIEIDRPTHETLTVPVTVLVE